MTNKCGLTSFPILIFAVAVAVGVVGWWGYNTVPFSEVVAKKATVSGEEVFCPQDAKLCPDGSYVGRTGPNCEFAECPGEKKASPAVPGAEEGFGSTSASPPPFGGGIGGTLQWPGAIDTSSWRVYVNTYHLFGFRYPRGHTVFTEINPELNAVVGATSQSNRAAVAEDEARLFTDTFNILSFEVVNEDAALNTWVDANVSKSMPASEIRSRRNFLLSGKQAVEVVGTGGGDSPYKLVVVKPGNYFIVITQTSPSTLLDEVFKSFTFSVQGLQ